MKKTMDKIVIENLEVFANHGVLEEENVLGQKFLVSAELEVSTRKAGISDALMLSVDYTKACKIISSFMCEHTFHLLEAVAENLALVLFANFEALNGVKITIKKPWAPIRMHVDYVGVTIERRWHRAYVAIGSNMGDKLKYLEDAVKAVKEDVSCRIIKISDIILTEPYGPVEQDDFMNGCIMLDTLYTPSELLRFLQKLENDANRVRDVHWGPRTLDLDILLYDDLVISDDELIIPHPEMHKRAFVLEPLKQIAPNVVHPLLHQRIRDMI